MRIFAPDADAGSIVREHVDAKKPDARRDPPSHFFGGTKRIGRISAVTFRVANMERSVPFYRDVLGMEIIFGSEDAYFSSLPAKNAQSAILNLEQGRSVTGSMIF
jgi:catechol-2,3-dioxygenase